MKNSLLAIDEASGEIVQLTDGPSVYLSSIMVSRTLSRRNSRINHAGNSSD